MEERMTVEEVIKVTVRLLGEIQIPVTMIDQVGAPIRAAVNNLNACLNAMQEVKDDGNADSEGRD